MRQWFSYMSVKSLLKFACWVMLLFFFFSSADFFFFGINIFK